MKIGIAQIKPAKGDVKKNIALHQEIINLAILNNADAIFFPELSITGYEPKLAATLKTDVEDENYESFQQWSDSGKITIGIGVPTAHEKGIHITMLLFEPNQPRQYYSKQLLHEDELPYFVKGNKQMIVETHGTKIAPAICYESLQTEHLENAVQVGADIYLASVAKSQKGIDKAKEYFREAARKNAIPVLMSNCIGHCDTFKSAGQSAVWDEKGMMITQLSDTEEGILIYDTIDKTTITSYKR